MQCLTPTIKFDDGKLFNPNNYNPKRGYNQKVIVTCEERSAASQISEEVTAFVIIGLVSRLFKYQATNSDFLKEDKRLDVGEKEGCEYLGWKCVIFFIGWWR